MTVREYKDTSDVFDAYHEDLRRFIRSKSQDDSLIDDIVQDSFFKLHLNLSNGKIITKPKSWLFRVAQNALIDEYRLSKKRSDLRTPLESEDHFDKPSHTPADCLRGIVAALPYKYKKAVYLADIKGVKQIDAADQLNIPLPTFKSHVQRGRKLVAQGYVDCCDYKIKEDGTLVGEIKDWEECKVCHS